MTDAIVINGGSDEKGTEKVLDFLAIHIEHQLLKYAAGKQMFCEVKNCKSILDYRKTVIITFNSGGTAVMCAKCFDSEPVQKVMKSMAKHIKDVTKFRKA